MIILVIKHTPKYSLNLNFKLKSFCFFLKKSQIQEFSKQFSEPPIESEEEDDGDDVVCFVPKIKKPKL